MTVLGPELKVSVRSPVAGTLRHFFDGIADGIERFGL